MLFDLLKKRYPDFIIKKDEDSYGDESVLLLNPRGDHHITIIYSYLTDDYKEYTFYFATQHAHFKDTESLTQYIDSFISGTKGAIEFYRNGKNVFGGDVEIPNEGIKSIINWANWLDYIDDIIIGLEVKITTWDGQENIHGTFKLRDGKAVLVPN